MTTPAPAYGGAGPATPAPGYEYNQYNTYNVQQQAAFNPVIQPHPLYLMALGGVEGYSGAAASRIDVGGTYGVALGVEPWRMLGFELGYSGGVNAVKGSGSTGPDIVRNGGYVIGTPGYALPLNGSGTSSLKPYLLGGIGLDGYNTANGGASAGYVNQTMGNVPFGGGLELRADSFVANARFNYNWEFGGTGASAGSFAPDIANPLRYQGQLTLGAAF